MNQNIDTGHYGDVTILTQWSQTVGFTSPLFETSQKAYFLIQPVVLNDEVFDIILRDKQ